MLLLQADTLGGLAGQMAGIPQQQEMSYSLISMAAKGGWLMLVLLALSIVAIYIFGKKWWMIHQAGKVDKDFMNDIKDYLHEGKTKSAINLCEMVGTPVALIVKKGLSRMDRPLSEVQAAMESVGNTEIARLEKGLSLLGTVAGGAPMIGFLGTGVGMVQAFFNMANAGSNVDISLLSGGIYTAMITTVGGLVVGIPAYFGYNYLLSNINDVVARMEEAETEFLDILRERNLSDNKE